MPIDEEHCDGNRARLSGVSENHRPLAGTAQNYPLGIGVVTVNLRGMVAGVPPDRVGIVFRKES